MQESLKLDVVAVSGEYTDETGKVKNRYCKVGTAWLYTKNGQYDGTSIVLDALPLSGKLRLLLPREVQ